MQSVITQNFDIEKESSGAKGIIWNHRKKCKQDSWVYQESIKKDAVCSKTKTENIAKTTKHLHTEIRNKKAATCGETGYTGDTYCTDCGTKVSSGKTIAKLTTHTWDEGKVTTEPTCTAKGVRTFTCSICAKTKTASIAATGHQHTEIRKKKDATCGEDGYTGDTYCTDCGKRLAYGQTIKKTGNHTWDDGKTTTEPTCTINGITTFTCSVCGYSTFSILL